MDGARLIIVWHEQTLATACLVLHLYCYDLTDVPALMLCSGTYLGFVIILSGEIIGELLFAPLDLVQDMFFGVVGVVLFSVGGGLLLSARVKGAMHPRTGDHNAALLLGSMSVVTAVAMFLDLTLAYLDSEEYDDDAREIVSAIPDSYVDAWWAASGAALFAASGGLTLYGWKEVPACPRRTYAQAAGICAVACAVVMLLDALYSFFSSTDRSDTTIRTKSVKMCKPCN